jgi:hypothetical protein
MPFKDITGIRFGKLVALAPTGKSANGATMWLCQCDCGEQSVCHISRLTLGRKKSCGCYRRLFLGNYRSHGHSWPPSRTYKSWAMMLQRCANPKNHNYPRYGGRGITVCERWLKFENFLADMDERPSGTTLDRIDPNGNYEPGNCRWATLKQQQNNRRNNKARHAPKSVRCSPAI